MSFSSIPQGSSHHHHHALHTYNTELLKALSDLKEKRQVLSAEISEEEQEKEMLQEEIAALTARLQGVEESLHTKLQTRNDYDRTLSETEAAFTKIIESSQTLLHVLKRESHHLDTKKKDLSRINRRLEKTGGGGNNNNNNGGFGDFAGASSSPSSSSSSSSSSTATRFGASVSAASSTLRSSILSEGGGGGERRHSNNNNVAN